MAQKTIMTWARFCRDAASLIAAGEGVGVEGKVVSNDRAVGTVAREVMSWLGWL
jgi:hypothetical protein